MGLIADLPVQIVCVAALVVWSGSGFSQTFPSSIARTFGECQGRILITPGKRAEGGSVSESSLIVYDCANKKFQTLKTASEPNFFGDFTAAKDGYYYTSTVFVDGVLHGALEEIDVAGRLRTSMRRRDMDLHDVVLQNSTRLYMKYVPGIDSLSCLDRVPLHSELVEETAAGKIIWTWSSAGKVDVSKNVATPETTDFDSSLARRLLRPIRHCMTVTLARFTDIEVPRFTFVSAIHPTLQYLYDDYVHANSIQILPNGNVLLSARHLDAVFEIDRKTGRIEWTIAGPASRMKGFELRGDPLKGFSHQHSASLTGDYLLLFDNGNLLGRASRAVIYRLNRDRHTAEFVQQFIEPNGRKRPATGSAYFIGKDRVIVGWGLIPPPDRTSTQRGVSIFDVRSGKEVFGIDFAPGYDSYRAKWAN